MSDKIIEYSCKGCGLLWSREFAEDYYSEIKQINFTLERCPACIYGN